MTITTENVIEYTTVIEDNIDKQNEKSNTKRQVNEHLTNNQNITHRKKQPQKIQNKTNKEPYWIDNLPPELTVENYPTLKIKKGQQKQITTAQTQPSQNITIIKEHPSPNNLELQKAKHIS